ncbi:MAG: carboxypeptidase regulatory-like domain-containing protein [Candidatus Solibacter usitatus]|nr:carboxypeptidase regulatory-like domain-containing protein [Candidatus Solibacter usitatus]
MSKPIRTLFIGAAFVSAAFAQTTATIVGAVTDPSGAVVSNATVTVTNQDTGLKRTVRSNDSGNYVAPVLPVGTYTVVGENAGFKRKSVTGIVLQVNQEARIDLALEVGATTETVTVSSSALLLQTENGVVGQVIDNSYTTQIPLNNRDFSQLILLTPGAVTRPGGTTLATGAATGSNGSGVAIGGRDNQNNFMIDGANNNARQFGNIAIKPSIDAIEEFKVLSNSYSAEFGSAAFGQVNLITKSGTNGLHGALFEFLRNDKLDARNFFLPKKSKLNRNQFGAAVGGPIRRDHTFFFFNYEGNRERRGVESFRSVPVEAWRNGDFSGIANLALRDPAGTGPFAGNRIPTSRFVKTATASIALWPKQDFGGATQISQNLLVTSPDQFNDDQVTLKMDHDLTSKDRLSGRYSRAAREEITTPSLPSFEQTIPPRNQVEALTHTRIWNPRVLSELRFAYTRSEFVQRSPNTGKTGFYDQFGINNPLAGSQFEGAPTLTFTNIALTSFGDGDFNTQRDISNEFTYAGSLSWTRGNHAIKGGFSLTRYQQNTPGPVTGLRRGSFNFRGDFTGQAFGDFLLGIPFTASRVVGKGVETGRSWWHGYYFNDDWKVSRKLTVNLGLRYEYVSPLLDVLNRRSSFWPLSNDYNTGQRGQVVVANSPEAKSVLNLSGVGLQSVYAPDRNNWAPRFGFAYSLNPKSVVRGAYGIFYTNSQNFVNNFVINRRQPPFAETQQITSSTARPEINIANPFINAAAALVIGTQNINPRFKEGYTQQWNLVYQRQFGAGINVEAAYVASKGTNLGELVFYNIPTPGPTATIQARRPFPLWGTALSLDAYVNSSYNTLQMKAQKRFAGGLSFLAAYTYGKSIDLSSERGSGDRGGGFDSSGNVRDLRASRALSGFDVRHRLVVSYVYALPIGRGKSLLRDIGPAANLLFGGWEISGITQFQGGFPFTPVMSADINGDGIPDRPDLVGPVTINSRDPRCYIVDRRNAACGVSTSSFVDLPAGSTRFGTSGRNILIGPGMSLWDMGISKNTRLRERMNLQFRWEMFNMFNHTNFNQPARTVNIASPAFGVITSAQRPREMQFGLKLGF